MQRTFETFNYKLQDTKDFVTFTLREIINHGFTNSHKLNAVETVQSLFYAR